MTTVRKASIIAFMLFGVGLLVLIFSPPLFDLSEETQREIEQIVRAETNDPNLKITAHSYFVVKVYATDSESSGGRLFRLKRTLSGWKVTDRVIVIE